MITPLLKSTFQGIINKVKLSFNPNFVRNKFFVHNGNEKIFIAIISCQNNKDKREKCRETWLKKLPENVEYKFFIGADDSYINDEDDVVCLRVNDSYAHLPEKIINVIFHVYNNEYDFDWFGKCDDDTFLRCDKLESILTPDNHAVGKMSTFGSFAYGGAGYFIKRNVINALVYAYKNGFLDVIKSGGEDIIIGEAVQKLGFEYTNCNLLCQIFVKDFDNRPELISNHHCF